MSLVVATSGDTGDAVANGFSVWKAYVYVLYPKGKSVKSRAVHYLRAEYHGY